MNEKMSCTIFPFIQKIFVPKIETDEKSSDVAKWSISVFCSESKSAIGHTQKRREGF